MIWRCYVLFNGKPWVVVLPGLGQLANTCVGYILISRQSSAPPGATVFQTASSLVTTFFSLTMCINVCCTATIAWRIHATGRFAGGSKSMTHILVAIVESGALYSTSVLALLIAYLERSNGQYPALDLIQPLIVRTCPLYLSHDVNALMVQGITFSLMILRIHFHLDSPNHTTTCGLDAIPRRYMWTPNGPLAARDDIGYPMHSLAVQVTEETSIGFPVEEAKKVSLEDTDGGADERRYTRR
ncbi:hypothetical protein EWM64_g7957 [Hericium alpestre]|uniref:Uncharacterized protein n=1 Tax=Hericium alpestre TaxID=135208 RepID=A0A4Y9ZN67_9AGAM|nr:hypothetical protein EWM64_g7957 [Hericium alpestre]